MSSIRDQILGADDLDTETVDVPEWGVTLLLRTPDARTRGRMMAAYVDNEHGDGVDWETFYARMVALCAFDPDTGERVFPEADDVGRLAQKNGAVVQRVGERCLAVAGMSKEAVDEGKDGS